MGTISKDKYANWNVDDCGLCYKSNVKFCSSISQKLSESYNKLNVIQRYSNGYHTLFKCGGGNKHCHAMIIHPEQFYDAKQNDIAAINMKLPSFPQEIGANVL